MNTENKKPIRDRHEEEQILKSLKLSTINTKYELYKVICLMRSVIGEYNCYRNKPYVNRILDKFDTMSKELSNIKEELNNKFSSIIIEDMDDDLIKFHIFDKVDRGAILPSGRVLENKDNNAYRSLHFALNKDGEIIDFRGYINTKNGLNEYFELNSVYAVPLYKKTHFIMEMLEELVRERKLFVKKLSAM